jgi:hypothetical protein
MSHMNTHELLELASLDVLGLLDTDEREAFERAFRAAPPALQAQIRREQLRIAGDDSLLPEVDSPLGLRARVLAAIREAVQSAMPRREIAGRIVPSIVPSRGVNRWWRAGAIGAAAASIVLGFAMVQIQDDYREIASRNEQNDRRDHMLLTFGAKFEQAFFDDNSRFVQFSPAIAGEFNPEGVSKATLVLNPNTKKGQLYLKNLPAEGGQYSLVITDENGQVARAVLEFSAVGDGVEYKNVELDLEGVPGLAIIEKTGPKINTLLKTRL